jgi:hypothetical protein
LPRRPVTDLEFHAVDYSQHRFGSSVPHDRQQLIASVNTTTQCSSRDSLSEISTLTQRYRMTMARDATFLQHNRQISTAAATVQRRNLRFACQRDRRLVSLIRGVSSAPRRFTQPLIRRHSGGRSYGRNAIRPSSKKGLNKVSL